MCAWPPLSHLKTIVSARFQLDYLPTHTHFSLSRVNDIYKPTQNAHKHFLPIKMN